ncbi:MAG: hypothetical protein AAF360_09165 [Pseudomonadota bacterium]
MPAPTSDLAATAEARLIEDLAQATGARTEAGQQASGQTAAASVSLKPAIVDVVLNRHQLGSTGVIGGETFNYVARYTGAIVDQASGAQLGTAVCQRARNIGSRRDFSLEAAKRAGVDVAPLLAEEDAAKEAARRNRSDERGLDAPSMRRATFATAEQEAAFMDHIATEIAIGCAAELRSKLLAS